MPVTYQDTIKIQSTLRQRKLLTALPPFLGDYFRSLIDHTSSKTRVGYAYDLKIFFRFLSEECPRYDNKPTRVFTEDDLAQVTSEDIEAFMEYLSYYIREGETDAALRNEALGKSRKLAAVRTMFRFYYRKKKIPANPAELVGFPKLHEKPIIALETDEIAKLLDEVDSGEKLNARQKQYHELTKVRDAAIIALLLGTGMRVSECVGIDLDHIDFGTNGARVTRKGGDEVILYFGDEVEKALKEYLTLRATIKPLAGFENALFLSIQRRRITDRAIQNLVKKYSRLVTTLKKITPHKLRSTFGTQLYKETGDIYLVASVLGHSDVNTTRKHYARMDDEFRRRAANVVKLRE